MHQNSPTAIADLKNFPVRNPRTPISEEGRYAAEGVGGGTGYGRWVGAREGMREGGRGMEGWVGAPLCEILNTPLPLKCDEASYS